MLSEIACEDGRDDDRDTKSDCADSDCSYAMICDGTGCKAPEQCDAGGSVSCPNGSVKENKGTACANGGQCVLCKEIACNDTLDNDGDLRIDEADNDCQNLQSILPSSIERRSLLNLFVGKAHAEEINGLEKTEDVEEGKTLEASMGSVSSSASSDSFFSKIFQRIQAFFSALLPDGSSLLGQVAGTPQCSDGLDNNNDGMIDFATYVNTIYLPQWEHIVDILVDAEHERTYVLGTRPDEPGPTPNTFYNPVLWEIDSRTFAILREAALPTGIIIQANSLIDTTRRIAYFGALDGTQTSAQIIRVDLAAMQLFAQSTLTLPAGSGPLGPAVIDTANNFAYYARKTNSDTGSKIMKINLGSTGSNLNTFQWEAEIGTEAITERHIVDAVIDPVAGFAYFGASPGQDPRVPAARIIKVQLNPFQKVQSVSLDPNTDTDIGAMAIDSENNTIYAATHLKNGMDLFLRKIRISPFELTAGTVQLLETDNYSLDRAMVMDTQRQMMYVGLKNANPSVAKINVNAELQDVIYRTQSNTMNPYVDSAVIDTAFHRVLFPVADGSISNRIPDGVMIISTADPDPGCSSANDQVEGIQCNDTRDNDGDGLVDRNDPGCYSNGNTVTGTYNPGDDTETNSVQCGNGAIEANEQCDDGNTAGNDGCSTSGQWEPLPVCLDNFATGTDTEIGGANYPQFFPDGTRFLAENNTRAFIGEVNPMTGIITKFPYILLPGAAGYSGFMTYYIIGNNYFILVHNSARQDPGGSGILGAEAVLYKVGTNGTITWVDTELIPAGNFAQLWRGSAYSAAALSNTSFAVAVRLSDNFHCGSQINSPGNCNGLLRVADVVNDQIVWRFDHSIMPAGAELKISTFDQNTLLVAQARNNGTGFTGEGFTATISTTGATYGAAQSLFSTTSSDSKLQLRARHSTGAAIAYADTCLKGATIERAGTTISAGNTWQWCGTAAPSAISMAISGNNDDAVAFNTAGQNGIFLHKIHNGSFVNPEPTQIFPTGIVQEETFDIRGRAVIAVEANVHASYCAVCQDGMDNDGDSLADFGADPGCSSPTDNNERGECYDGLDNDNDTLRDCADPACHPGGIVINPNSCTPPEAARESANTPRCGDGATDANEQCDDGNLVAGDGCSIICTNEGCGNGQIDPPEQCDDGNSSNVDSCPDGTGGSCRSATCGDGFVWTTGNPNPAGPEVCDDKTENGQPNRCNNSCSGTTPSSCGNGYVEQGEQCDDGNTAGGDGCATSCQSESPTICKEVFGATVSTGWSMLPSAMDALPNGKFVVVSGKDGHARIGMAATNGIISWLTGPSIFEIGSVSPGFVVPADVAWIDENRFVVTYSRQGGSKAIIGEKVGGVIEWGTPVNISLTVFGGNATLKNVAVTRLNAEKFAVALRKNSSELMVSIGKFFCIQSGDCDIFECSI